MDKDKLAYRQFMSPGEAVVYLEGLIKGLKAGSVLVSQGADSLTLSPAQEIEVEVEARRKKDKERFSLEFSWRVAPEVIQAEKLSVGAPETPAAPAATASPCCAKAPKIEDAAKDMAKPKHDKA